MQQKSIKHVTIDNISYFLVLSPNDDNGEMMQRHLMLYLSYEVAYMNLFINHCFDLEPNTPIAIVDEVKKEHGDIVVIPEMVTYNDIIYIVRFIFTGSIAREHTKSLTIPSTIWGIGFNALYGEFDADVNYILTEIIVSPDNPYFDSRNNCNAIIETPTNKLRFACDTTIIPDTITTICNLAFCNCNKIISINIPSSVKKVEIGAFEYCENLEVVCTQSAETFITQNAFSHCPSLKVSFPEGLEYYAPIYQCPFYAPLFSEDINILQQQFEDSFFTQKEGLFQLYYSPDGQTSTIIEPKMPEQWDDGLFTPNNVNDLY